MSNSTTLLDTISSSQAQKEVTANAMHDASSPSMLFGRRASTTAALTWGYYGGYMWVDGALTAIANGTVALTASQTNYVEATRAGVVSKNTTAFTPGSIPLYTVVTGTATITSYTDARVSNVPTYGRLTKSIAGGAGDTTLTAAEARVNEIRLTGALTGNRTVTMPTTPWTILFDNQTSGAYTASVKTAAGASVAVTQGTATLLYCDGVDVKTAITSFPGLSITSGKTLTVSNSLTLAGTDGTTMTFPSTSATIARTDAGNTFTGVSTATGWTINTPIINTAAHVGGTWVADATWTLPAYTMGGAISNPSNYAVNLGTGALTAGSLTTTALAAHTSAAESWMGPSSTTGVYFKGGNVGIGTTAPDKALEINSATGANLRLTYNDANGSAANYADFSMSSGGNLTIAPSGGTLAVTGALSSSGNVMLGDATTDTVTVNGHMGVGGAGNSTLGLRVGSTALTGTAQIGIYSLPVATSAATSYVAGLILNAGAVNSAFSMSDAYGLVVENGSIGASVTLTNQYGILISDQTKGASNYGLRTLVSSGTNKWNIYASGTAANYFAGNVGIGTASILTKTHVADTSAGAQTIPLRVENTSATAGTEVGIQFSPNAAASTTRGALITGLLEGSNGTELLFYTNASSAVPTAKMRLSTGGNLALNATTKLYLDGVAGTGDTYITESSANVLDLYAGANKTLSLTATGAAVTGELSATTSILSSGATSGIGYATGAGGAVTQGTNRTTGVTLNKASGAITLVSAAGSTSWQTFTVTNSAVAATDVVIVDQKSGADLNEIHVTAVAAGSFNITFRTTGGTTTEQPVFNFAVIKGVTS